MCFSRCSVQDRSSPWALAVGVVTPPVLGVVASPGGPHLSLCHVTDGSLSLRVVRPAPDVCSLPRRLSRAAITLSQSHGFIGGRPTEREHDVLGVQIGATHEPSSRGSPYGRDVRGPGARDHQQVRHISPCDAHRRPRHLGGIAADRCVEREPIVQVQPSVRTIPSQPPLSTTFTHPLRRGRLTLPYRARILASPATAPVGSLTQRPQAF